jgi:hypothetical protein
MSLTQFLVDLATNADLKHRYEQDPVGTMTGAGLTIEERTAVLSRDSGAVRTALGKPDNDCMSQTGQSVPAGSRVKRSHGLPEITVTQDSFLISKSDRTALLAKRPTAAKRGAKRASTTAKKKGGARGGKKR